MRIFLNELYDRYKMPVMIVENGLGVKDDVLEQGDTVHDPYRIAYLKEHIRAVNAARKQDGINDVGCAGMSVRADETRPEDISIISRWEEEATLQASDTFLKYKACLKPCFAGNVTTILVQK